MQSTKEELSEKPTPRISVIVPIYNVERFLTDCLESFCAQTFDDFEVLLVNDGSKDGSGAICDEYAKKDARFRVFHLKNGGVSRARNFGLNQALGEYVCFVDSDDWVSPSFLEVLLSMMERGGELCICAFRSSCEGSAGTEVQDSLFLPRGGTEALVPLDTRGEEDFLFLNSQGRFNSPWAKLYKRSILEQHQIRFLEDMHYGEDVVFNYTYLPFVSSVAVSSLGYYYYRIQREGALSARFSEQRPEWLKACGDKVRAFFEGRGFISLESQRDLGETYMAIFTAGATNLYGSQNTLSLGQRYAYIAGLFAYFPEIEPFIRGRLDATPKSTLLRLLYFLIKWRLKSCFFLFWEFKRFLKKLKG